MRTILFVTGIVLSTFAAQASDTKTYAQICDNSRLRAVERADCHARMKAATNENVARDVFRTFSVKVNGSLAQ